MKKLIVILGIVLLSITSKAQNEEVVDLQNRITALETMLKLQQQSIASLQSQVAEVTRQNLALKQSLNLRPTVAEAIDGDGNVLKIIEVKGDITSNKVIILGMCNNPTGNDTYINMRAPNMIDENGKEYILDYENGHIGATAITNLVTLMPDTPVEVEMLFPEVMPGTQYIKTLELETTSGRTLFRFRNLPIKWQ